MRSDARKRFQPEPLNQNPIVLALIANAKAEAWADGFAWARDSAWHEITDNPHRSAS